MENKNVLLTVLTALVVLSLIVGFAQNMGVNNKVAGLEEKIGKIVAPNVPSATDIAKLVLANMPAPVASTSTATPTATPVASGSYSLTKAEFEEKAVEDKALELATASVNSRDFKKAVVLLLTDVESYKDITEVKVKETDVDGEEVEFEVIVYYFTDDDEDNKMKAYLDLFTVAVDDLDFDDEFEDAEADDSYLSSLVVNKVKEI
jgi:hypothetical protein